MASYTNRSVIVISGEWGWSTCTNRLRPSPPSPRLIWPTEGRPGALCKSQPGSVWNCGCGSTTGQPMPCIGGAGTGNNTLEDQAKYLVRSWYGCEPLSLLPWLGGALDPIGRPLHRRLVNAMENIPISIYYDWLNDGTDSEQGENNFGSVENAYYNASLPHIPKPAFSAASVLQGAIGNAAYTGRRDARVGSSTATVDPETFVLAFENNFVVWKINGTLACTRDVRQRIDCGTPGRFAGGGGACVSRLVSSLLPPWAGYSGISQQQCEARGCCYLPYGGPWCSFKGVTNTTGVVYFQPASAAPLANPACYQASPPTWPAGLLSASALRPPSSA